MEHAIFYSCLARASSHISVYVGFRRGRTVSDLNLNIYITFTLDRGCCLRGEGAMYVG